jgi:hypothetical protein
LTGSPSIGDTGSMRRPLGLALAAACALAACDDSSADSEGGGGGGASGDSGTPPVPGSAPDSGSSADSGSTGTADTWASFASGFFQSYCVECHGAGNTSRDYTLYEQVVRDAELIQCGVAVEKQDGCGDWPPPQQFPIGTGAKPSDDERRRLVEWIGQGAAE